MIDQLLEKIPKLKKGLKKYQRLFTQTHVAARATLLREGEVPTKIFIIKKGCLRTSFNDRGKEITFQFFFENDVVASIESFRTNQPSPISIKSIEPSTLIILHKKDYQVLLDTFPEFKDFLLELFFKRFSQYSHLFLSYIRDTPLQRYQELLKENPRIIQRIPQHYIASYLGITPVSLSRIRKRV